MADQPDFHPGSESSRTSPPGLIKRNWRSVFILFALAADLASIVTANFAAYVAYGRVAHSSWHEPPPFFESTLLLSGILIFFGLLLGLYRATFHSKISAQYLLGGKVYLYSVVTALALFFVARMPQYHRTYLALLFLYIPAFFLLYRAVLNRFNLLMQRWGFGVNSALVVEYDHRFDDILMNRFTSFPELGYKVVGHIAKHAGLTRPRVKQDISHIRALMDANSIDSVFIPSVGLIEDGFSELVDLCVRRNIRLKVLSKESDDLLRFVYITDLAGISLVAPARRRIEIAKRFSKRAFDLAVALVSLVVLSPILFIVTVAILVEDGRPILYHQKRGLVSGGQEFIFYKFRSMHKDAEVKQKDLYKKNRRTGGLFLIEDDPRLTRVGKLIRKYSIDELPQLYNVLKGDMSLVGPRPLSVVDLANIAPENRFGGYYRLRAKAKPGITGLWQISGRRELGFREMVLLDLYYIENQSMLFDLEILFQTVPVVLFGKGAY